MGLTRAAKVGAFLLALGLATLLAVAIWLKTTRDTLADFPMPMRAETISRDFAVGYDGPAYTMMVRFDRTVSETEARCLLGATKSPSGGDLDCSGVAPVLQFSWQLRRDGEAGGSGSSENQGTILNRDDGPQVMIVGFPAQKKRRYEVVLRFDNNASSLSIPPPRIQIELDSFVREDLFFAGAVLDVVAVALCLVGTAMFSFSFLRARLNRSKMHALPR
jgi:hypothetical protein